MDQTKEFLTPVDVAAELDILPNAVRRHIHLKELKADKSPDGHWLIQPEAAQEFISRYRAGEIGQSRKGIAHPDHPLHGSVQRYPPDPNSLAAQGKQTQVRIPATEDHAKWLREMIPPADRLAILDHYARMKEVDPARYEEVVRSLSNGK